jgi:GDPmannose 4,6-dehydratase
MPKALITGISGQDGSYLAELLLEKGYEVHGTVRRSSVDNTERLHGFKGRLHLHYGDLSDSASLMEAVARSWPDEVYNLGAMSDVGVSFKTPIYSADVTGTGTIRLLECLRSFGSKARIYQATSSECFGSSPPPQNESTPFHPRSPYACAKVFSYHATVNYREAFGMHASNGILFNHEAPIRRGENFVTRKIAKAVARIKAGTQKELYLGNLEARRDWGYAKDFVEAMWLMLQQPTPDDFVIATGEAHSVREFADAAFTHVGLDYRDYVRTDSNLFRPSEVEYLLGDPSKAKRLLGWEPKVTFNELVRMMVDAEL